MVQKIFSAIAKALRGVGSAVRREPGIFFGVAAAVFVFNLAVPVITLSIVRKPVDFFTFNPWLSRLPEYLASEQPLSRKLSFLANMAIAWVSANGIDGVEWSFLLDVPTLFRVTLMSLVFGAYFALWSRRRRLGQACGLPSRATRPAGVAGVVTSVLGLTTGPCSLAGCGAPILPVVALAFSGLSSSTLTLFTTVSQISAIVVFALMVLAVAWFGWRVATTEAAGTLQPSS